MSLTKYWAHSFHTEQTEDFTEPMYLADDLESLLNDPQALAALLVERAGKEKP